MTFGQLGNAVLDHNLKPKPYPCIRGSTKAELEALRTEVHHLGSQMAQHGKDIGEILRILAIRA